MKPLVPLFKSLFVGLAILAPTQANAILLDFQVPPFTSGATVNGQQRWAVVGTGLPGNANVVATTTAAGGFTGHALYMKATATPSTTVARYTFETPIQDKQVLIEASMSFTSTGTTDTSANARIYFGTEATSPLVFGYNQAAGSGLYFSTVNGETGSNQLILAHANVVRNAIYSFSISLDYEAKTFDLKVFGPNLAVGGAIYNDIAFRNGAPASLGSVSYGINSQFVGGYLKSIEINAIPEGKSMAYMVIGLAFVGSAMVVHRRKAAFAPDSQILSPK